jgi:cell division transport system ATP-binding protein
MDEFLQQTKKAPVGHWSAAPKLALFDLRQVYVELDAKLILHQINLQINRTDFIYLTGPTGAGKTTLLRFLYGEIKHSSGDYFTRLESNDQKLFVSRVFQDLKLFSNLNVLENLLMAYDPSTFSSSNEFDRELDEYCHLFGLKEFLATPVEKISGGLKQKVAIIRSLLTRPDVILADEPTSNLDRRSAHQLFDIFNFLNVKRKLTVVWATHNHELIKNFHGKLIHLEKGRITYAGQPC